MTPRACTINDCDTFARIHSRVFTGTASWTKTGFLGMLRLPTTLGWVIGNPAISFIVCTRVLDEGEILTLATDPNHQRQGYAATLLTHAIHHMADLKVGQIFLDVSEHNTIARALYTRFNFQQIGTRPHYYENPRAIKDKAIILKLDINKK